MSTHHFRLAEMQRPTCSRILNTASKERLVNCDSTPSIRRTLFSECRYPDCGHIVQQCGSSNVEIGTSIGCDNKQVLPVADGMRFPFGDHWWHSSNPGLPQRQANRRASARPVERLVMPLVQKVII